MFISSVVARPELEARRLGRSSCVGSRGLAALLALLCFLLFSHFDPDVSGREEFGKDISVFISKVIFENLNFLLDRYIISPFNSLHTQRRPSYGKGNTLSRDLLPADAGVSAVLRAAGRPTAAPPPRGSASRASGSSAVPTPPDVLWG